MFSSRSSEEEVNETGWDPGNLLLVSPHSEETLSDRKCWMFGSSLSRPGISGILLGMLAQSRLALEQVRVARSGEVDVRMAVVRIYSHKMLAESRCYMVSLLSRNHHENVERRTRQSGLGPWVMGQAGAATTGSNLAT